MSGMHPRLKDAVSLFNQQDYFNCHEILEEVWRESSTDDKHFYEGLIRLSTGLHLRFHRRIQQGAINLLTQGLMRLEQYQPTYLGVDVARLYKEVDEHLQNLKASKKAQPGFLERWRTPRIYFTD